MALDINEPRELKDILLMAIHFYLPKTPFLQLESFSPYKIRVMIWAKS